MYQFKPQMKDGMGESMKVSPEAHKEWADKEGKHSAIGMAKVNTSEYQNSKHVGPDGFDPGKRIHSREAETHMKSHEEGNHGPFGKGKGLEADTGHKTGPQMHAGKGPHEGGIKGPGGAGKINYGNGLQAGKKVPGLAKGKKTHGEY
jgi:hypothetical protein